MQKFTPWTKRLIIGSILAISITAMALDFTGGKELALIGIVCLKDLVLGE